MQAGGGRIQFGAHSFHLRMLRSVALGTLLNLGPRLGLICLELLNQWMTEHCRNSCQLFPVATIGLNLAILAFGFRILEPGIDQPVTGARQFRRADRRHTTYIDQILRLPITLQTFFRDFELLA
ncbi:hypothetical protein D3C78_1189100 [compost metagenome]